MAEIVAEKFWVKIGRKELEDFIREVVPEDMCDFELIEAQPPVKSNESDSIEYVTFGLRYHLLTDGPDQPCAHLAYSIRCHPDTGEDTPWCPSCDDFVEI
jgi:hypothetical protein